MIENIWYSRYSTHSIYRNEKTQQCDDNYKNSLLKLVTDLSVAGVEWSRSRRGAGARTTNAGRIAGASSGGRPGHGPRNTPGQQWTYLR